MIVVVSDTSPIRALSHLGRLSLLGDIYEEVFVPPAVVRELENPPEGQARVGLVDLPFVRVRTVAGAATIGILPEGLDPGESEALALALDIGADLVLIDEAAGRLVARRLGLARIGVLGILLEAKHRGLVDLVGPLIDRLRDDHGFFVSERVRSEVLRLAGES